MLDMKKIIFFAGIIMLLTACGKKAEEPLVEFTTTEGTVVVKLYKDTPQHRDNMVKLVKSGYYDGLLFHKAMKDFLVQTGDPNSKDASHNRLLGTGGPGYTIPQEIHYPELFHKRGVLSAARLSDAENPAKESNGSQFYFILGKKYTPAELDSIEKEAYEKQVESIWQRVIILNKDKINAVSMQNDKRKMEALQDSLTVLAEKEIDPKKVFHFAKAQREAYTKVGGVPFMDKEYTVFGEVVRGLDVVEKISNEAVDMNNRPQNDVRILKAKIVKE